MTKNNSRHGQKTMVMSKQSNPRPPRPIVALAERITSIQDARDKALTRLAALNTEATKLTSEATKLTSELTRLDTAQLKAQREMDRLGAESLP